MGSNKQIIEQKIGLFPAHGPKNTAQFQFKVSWKWVLAGIGKPAHNPNTSAQVYTNNYGGDWIISIFFHPLQL